MKMHKNLVLIDVALIPSVQSDSAHINDLMGETKTTIRDFVVEITVKQTSRWIVEFDDQLSV